MKENISKRPRIGVGILVVHEGKILLGKRKGSHGAATWALPGGHLEFSETPANCAERELFEETNLKALEVLEGPWTNDLFHLEDRHYVTIFIIVKKFEGNLILKEPEKCEKWEWFDRKNLPSPLFLPLENLFKNHSLDSLLND